MWKDSYLIGVQLIDDQHKELFRIVGDLLLVLKDDKDIVSNKTKLADAIAFLKGYVVKHFKDEEEYMAKKGFKDIEAHKAYHVELTQDVLNYEKQLVESDFAIPVVKKFLGFVNVWLIQHVAGIDQKYADDFVQETVSDDIDSKVIEVIKMMTGDDMDDVDVYREGNMPEGGNLCFVIGLVGSSNKTIGFMFSDKFTSSVFIAMTGMEFDEHDDLVISAMSEISNVIAGNIVTIVSGNDPNADIKIPEHADSKTFPAESEITLLKTNLGDMAVLVY